MSAFISIAWLDTFELCASLPKRMGLLPLQVRGSKAGADDPDDDLSFVQSKAAASWPELRVMLARIKRLGDQTGGIEFGRISVGLLPAGRTDPWWRDESPYATRFASALLPLRTNPGVVIYSNGEQWTPVIGWLTIVARGVSSAINLGEHPAIWLAVDFRKKETP